MTPRRLLSLTTAIILLAGCGNWLEPQAIRQADEFLREGKLGDAMRAVENVLKEQPDSLPAKRLRVWVLLKADQIDLASDALRELPARDNAIAGGLTHRDQLVRVGAAKLAALQPSAVKLDTLTDGCRAVPGPLASDG